MHTIKHPGLSGLVKALLSLALAASVAPVHGQAIERVKANDISLDCAAIRGETTNLEGVIAAGEGNAVGQAVAGGAANVGGQVAGAVVAQSLGGMFGGLGGLFSRATGAVAQTTVQEQMKPNAEARQRATQAQARKDFLARLASAKDCSASDPGYIGKVLSAQAFEQLAGTGATAQVAGQPVPVPVALTRETINPALSEPITVLPLTGMTDGKLELKGKRFYIAEFRVLFDVGGTVVASTRAGYLPGRNYGATSARINYKVPNIDIAAFQAITDKAYEDFKARLFRAGVKIEDTDAFVRANGAVYEATEAASQPGAPVYFEKNLGGTERKYLVMAPTGMKLHSRGFAGLGAGNISKRIDFSKSQMEGVSISMAVNIAALETSGSGSSILRSGSSVNAGEGMAVGPAPDSALVQTHVNSMGVRMTKHLPIEGNFAKFRETGGFNSSTDAVSQSMAFLSNRAGVAANNTSRTEMEVDLDGPATTRMALRGLASINQSVVEQIRAGL